MQPYMISIWTLSAWVRVARTPLVSFNFVFFSLCKLCGYCDFNGTNFHKYLPKEFGLQRTATAAPHLSDYFFGERTWTVHILTSFVLICLPSQSFKGHALDVPCFWQFGSLSKFQIYNTLFGQNRWVGLSTLWVLFCSFVHNVASFVGWCQTSNSTFSKGISCVFALGVNISNYLVLGKTSPLTYQVLSKNFACQLVSFEQHFRSWAIWKQFWS